MEEVSRSHQAVLAYSRGLAIVLVGVVEVGVVEEQVTQLVADRSDRRRGVGDVGDLVIVDIAGSGGCPDVDLRATSGFNASINSVNDLLGELSFQVNTSQVSKLYLYMAGYTIRII